MRIKIEKTKKKKDNRVFYLARKGIGGEKE